MKTTYIQSNDVKLFVRISEPENKQNEPVETVLFLHGFPDNHKTWDYQVEAFQKEYKIIRFDNRGTGSSSAPAKRTGYHIDNLMQDVDSVLNALTAKDEKVHLVGHDWGGAILWSYISFPPYSKKALSFTSINGPHPTLFVKNIKDSLVSFDPFAVMGSVNQIMKSWYMLFFQFPRLPETLLMAAPEFLWKMLHSQTDLPDDDEFKNLTRDEILSSSIGPINMYRELFQGGLPPLPETPINIPISLILSENDISLTKLVYEKVDSIASHIDMRAFKANHWVHREKAEEVNRMLSIFWKRAALKK